MVLTMYVSTQLFHAHITPQLVLAAVLVVTSTVQYSLPTELLRVDEEDLSTLNQLIDETPSNAKPGGAGQSALQSTGVARA